jgi:hypothetical protein
VTHQDDELLEVSTRCGECNRTLGPNGRHSVNPTHSNFTPGFDNDMQKSFCGQVITNIRASKKEQKDPSVPIEGIMTRTEFTRDVESMGDGSSLSDKREDSTDVIREGYQH